MARVRPRLPSPGPLQAEVNPVNHRSTETRKMRPPSPTEASPPIPLREKKKKSWIATLAPEPGFVAWRRLASRAHVGQLAGDDSIGSAREAPLTVPVDDPAAVEARRRAPRNAFAVRMRILKRRILPATSHTILILSSFTGGGGGNIAFGSGLHLSSNSTLSSFTTPTHLVAPSLSAATVVSISRVKLPAPAARGFPLGAGSLWLPFAGTGNSWLLTESRPTAGPRTDSAGVLSQNGVYLRSETQRRRS